MDVTSYLLGKQAGGGGGSITLQDKSLTITENTTTTVSADVGYDGLGSVEITTNVPSSSGGLEEKDVNFYDYDGTLVDSYTKNEFLALSAMPDNPTHEGLTSQGWNWSLADAKEYVTTNDILDIGQLYVTSDGKTRVYITLTEELLDLYLGIAPVGNVDIDWGDGSEHSTVFGQSTNITVNTQHTYSAPGDYVITLDNDSYLGITGTGAAASQLIWNNTSNSIPYRYTVKKINLGSNVKVKGNGFSQLREMKELTVAQDTVWDGSTIFQANQYLKIIILNDNFQSSAQALSIGSGFSLERVILPKNFTYFNDFSECTRLKRFCAPDGLTSMMMSNSSNAEEVIIPKTITSLNANTFNSCYSLRKIKIPANIQSIGASVFQNCRSLKEVVIEGPISSIESRSFSGCHLLKDVTLPSTLQTLKSQCFSYCAAIIKMTFPSGITSIEASAFSNCTSIILYDFRNASVVPTLGGTNAFSNINANCKIVVPDSLYDDWIAATNWSNYASYIVKESDYND